MGSHCTECIREAQPPARERARRWTATAGPLVTKVIIGLNLAVFLAITLDVGRVVGWTGNLQADLALFGPAVAGGEWWRLVTSGFVHYGIMHIAFNMLILYQFGGMLEPALGRLRFVALYLAGLLTGSFGAVLLDPQAFTAGASGAVFGLFGAAAVGLRQRGVNVWQSGIGPLLAINLVLTFVIPNISIGGHVGGLAGGAAAGAFMLGSPTDRRSVAAGLAVAAVIGVAAAAGALWTVQRV